MVSWPLNWSLLINDMRNILYLIILYFRPFTGKQLNAPALINCHMIMSYLHKKKAVFSSLGYDCVQKMQSGYGTTAASLPAADVEKLPTTNHVSSWELCIIYGHLWNRVLSYVVNIEYEGCVKLLDYYFIHWIEDIVVILLSGTIIHESFICIK